LTAEGFAKKRRVLDGGLGHLWEVVDYQSLSQCFLSEDDNQGRGIIPGKTLPASKRCPLHGLAFLTGEAAKQEGLEEIRPSPFSGDDSGTSMRGLLLVLFLAHIPFLLNGCPK
jgi:hypothetical protein